MSTMRNNQFKKKCYLLTDFHDMFFKFLQIVTLRPCLVLDGMLGNGYLEQLL